MDNDRHIVRHSSRVRPIELINELAGNKVTGEEKAPSMAEFVKLLAHKLLDAGDIPDDGALHIPAEHRSIVEEKFPLEDIFKALRIVDTAVPPHGDAIVLSRATTERLRGMGAGTHNIEGERIYSSSPAERPGPAQR